MTNYPRSAYGSNPNAGVTVNADNGWGSYKWPDGVPSRLLGTTRYTFKTPTSLGTTTTATITLRKELIELFELTMQIADAHGYVFYGSPNPGRNDPTWGPFSYENRPIGGTQRASNHSRARAWDGNAPRNPQSRTFECDMPPAMVADFESIGWCWGGRYVDSKFDTMHYEYGYRPENVAGHVAKARAILARLTGGSPTKPTTPTTPKPEGFLMALSDKQQNEIYRILTDIDKAGISLNQPNAGEFFEALLGDTQRNSNRLNELNGRALRSLAALDDIKRLIAAEGNQVEQSIVGRIDRIVKAALA